MMAPFGRLLPWIMLVTFLAVIAWSWLSQGIVFDLAGSDLTAQQRVDRLKEFFNNFGASAPLVYLVFVVVEVVIAPIPGLMLYAPGGIIFGPLIGGGVALLGNMLGAGLACSVTRSFGTTWLSRFLDAEKLERTQQLIEHRGGWIIFLLRLNPLTSSDIVSYAAGFTRISIVRLMVATGVGMAPLCFLQAWLAEDLLTTFPWLLYPLILTCVAYFLLVIVVIRRMTSGHSESPSRS